ncbi:MAG: rRNA maturation RNase YbeY [Bacteroidales bacterium]|nr:rRNA maturation RNase YbeY [Bacteroidales bacterium]
MAREENKNIGRLAYIFCSDEYLLNINKKYLKHNYLTDVITFDYTNDNEISGDIFISAERVKENAKTYGQTFFCETLRVILHGALHLCGYKDKTEAEKKQMRAKENYYLEKYLNI